MRRVEYMRGGQNPHQMVGDRKPNEFLKKHFSEAGETTPDQQMKMKRSNCTPDTMNVHRELRCGEHLSKHERVTAQKVPV